MFILDRDLLLEMTVHGLKLYFAICLSMVYNPDVYDEDIYKKTTIYDYNPQTI